MMSKKESLLPTLFQLQGRSPRSPKSIQRLVFGFPPQFTFPFGLIKHGPDVANCCDLEQSLIYNLKWPRQKGECSKQSVSQIIDQNFFHVHSQVFIYPC